MVEVERFANGRNFHITKADVTDRNGAIEMILLNLNNLPCVKNIHGSTVEVIKKSDLHKFQGACEKISVNKPSVKIKQVNAHQT